MSARLKSLRKHLLPATPWWLLAFVVVGFVWHSNAECSFEGFIVAGALLIVWALAWAARLVLGARGGRVLQRPLLSWGIEPVLVGAVIFMMANHGFLWLRFLPSLPSLNGYAKRQLALAEPASRPPEIGALHDSVGLFRALSWKVVKASDGSSQFCMLTASPTMTDASGFVYIPSGARPSPFVHTPSYYTHLVGPWWIWRLDV